MSLDLWTSKDTEVSYQNGYLAPTVTATGAVTSRLMSPSEYALWLVVAELADGAELSWDRDHGDEIVYVHHGELSVDGRICPADGAVLVEAGVAVTVRARGATKVAHFGPRDRAAPTTGAYGAAPVEGRSAVVVGPAGMWARHEPGRHSKFYADSSQPTSRLTLLYTARDGDYVSSSHSHSEDEIIYLLKGSIQVGRDTLSTGDAIGIAGDRRYGFRCSGGFGFLNYRRDASLMTINPKEPSFLEGGEKHGFDRVMDVR